MANNLKSYKVFTKSSGELIMVIIVNEKYSLELLNKLFNNGMSAVVVNERSALVDKRYVDTVEIST